MCTPINTGTDTEMLIVCEKTRKPITVTNKYGMFCEDMCDLKECKEADKKIEKFLDHWKTVFWLK
jgi:hypothetical protein